MDANEVVELCGVTSATRTQRPGCGQAALHRNRSDCFRRADFLEAHSEKGAVPNTKPRGARPSELWLRLGSAVSFALSRCPFVSFAVPHANGDVELQPRRDADGRRRCRPRALIAGCLPVHPPKPCKPIYHSWHLHRSSACLCVHPRLNPWHRSWGPALPPANRACCRVRCSLPIGGASNNAHTVALLHGAVDFRKRK